MPLAAEVGKGWQGLGGPYLKPQVGNLWDQIEKGLCRRRHSGKSLREVLEGSLICLRTTLEPVGVSAERKG